MWQQMYIPLCLLGLLRNATPSRAQGLGIVCHQCYQQVAQRAWKVMSPAKWDVAIYASGSVVLNVCNLQDAILSIGYQEHCQHAWCVCGGGGLRGRTPVPVAFST